MANFITLKEPLYFANQNLKSYNHLQHTIRFAKKKKKSQVSSTGSVGWRGTPWPLKQPAGGIPQSRERSGWWHLGEAGGTGRRTDCCWHRLCSHQRALPIQLTPLGYAAHQRPSCSNWPQLPNKIFICKHLKTNHACMGRDEFQVLSRSTGIQTISLT